MNLPPYPAFNDGEMNFIKFDYMVVSENFVSKFELPVKKEIKLFIEQCWSNDPNKKSTFTEILLKIKALKYS